MVRIGCSGWNYRDWRGAFYPQKLAAARWLGEYAHRFDTVEVNSTFYRTASRAAVERWVADTPDDFCFAVKASRYLTHVKRLRDHPDKGFALAQGIAHFYAPLAPLIDSGRLGPVLWQLPANFRRDDDRIAELLETAPPGRHCLEFRHASWFCEPVYELLRRHDAALVIGDSADWPFQAREITASWTFLRLHRGRRGRGGNYSDAELADWAERIAGWRDAGADVYAYFNNDQQAFAPRNAAALAKLLE